MDVDGFRSVARRRTGAGPTLAACVFCGNIVAAKGPGPVIWVTLAIHSHPELRRPLSKPMIWIGATGGWDGNSKQQGTCDTAQGQCPQL